MTLFRLVRSAVAVVSLAFSTVLALAQPAGLVNTGAFATLVGAVEAGSTQVDVIVPVSGLSSLRVQAIVPVNGARISLISPSGAVVLEPTDTGIAFADGQALTPPLPGGVFITPELANPVDGNWVLRATFPASAFKTIVLLTVFAESPYQVGLVLTAPSYRIGQPVPLGLLAVRQGLPLLGLQPVLTVRKDGLLVATLPAVDNGQPGDFDGLVGDGIYSQGYTFADLGRYEVVGQVSIPLPGGGSVTRTATGFIDIVPVNYTLGSVLGTVVNGNNCVARLDVSTQATAVLPGVYATAATLKAPSGVSILKRTTTTLAAPGALTATVSFTSSEIRARLAQGGVFVVDPLDVVSLTDDTTQLEVRRPAALSFPNLALTQFCTDPIEIGTGATVATGLRQNFIGQLDFKLPISVNTAGSYQVSFKVIDGLGQEVGQFGLTQQLAAGGNTISATVLAGRLQKSDGPFSVESVLVVRGTASAQASRVPVAGSAFSRWQFFPTVTADLNGDESVNAADQSLLNTFRNATSLLPGDRRDINRDGKIDVRDAREVVLRACSAPNCPRD